MKRTYLVFILLFCYSGFAVVHAQNRGRAYADSVLKELGKVEDDTMKVFLYETLANEYDDLNVDSALFFGEKFLDIAQKVKWKDFIIYAYQKIGFTHHLMTHYDTALTYFNKALKEYTKTNDSIGIADAYMNMSRTYSADNQLSKGLSYAFKTLNIYKQYNLDGPLVGVYTEIADLYSNAHEHEKAMSYYQSALSLSQQVGDNYDNAFLLLSLGTQYLKLENVDSALYYSQMAKASFEKLNNEYNVAYAIDNIAEVYLLQNKYNEAQTNFKKSGAFYISTNDKESIAVNLYNIGKVHLFVAADTTGYKPDTKLFATTAKKNYEIAIDYLERARSIYGTELNRKLELADITKLLSMAYEGIGNPAKALFFYKEYLAIDDSIKKQNEGKKIAQLDAEREIELKDKELELQKLLIVKKRNERGLLIAGIAILLIGLIVVFRSYRARGHANKLLAIEKNKSEELLLNILPEEVAEELKEKGSANAMHFDEVTVLFTDFVDFTKAGERLSSQELVDELHTCFKAFDEITSKYHIEKIKTIGDAYLAVSGLPAADDKHAEQVVNAAIEILKFMKERQAIVGDKTFKIRIGVHSGDVVAGIVGVKKFAYDIWGDTVNTASRIEQNSAPNKINISQTTYDLVKDKFACDYRGELEAKNKGKLKMYFIEA